MPWFGLRSIAQPKGPEISQNDAFDILAAKALEMEQYPREVVQKGVALGWAERMKMLAGKYNWDFRFTIKDK